MRDKTKRTFVAVVSNLLMIAILLAGVVYADVVNIDTFNSGTQSLEASDASPRAASSVSVGTGDVLGGHRDAEVNWISGTGGAATLKIDVGLGDGTDWLAFSTESSIVATGKVTWDGDSDPDLLTADGLGGADLSGSGSNDGIFLRIISADLEGNLKFTAYNDANNYEDHSITFNQAGVSIQHLDLFFGFDDFVTREGSGATWSSLGALELDISGVVNVDMTIDYIEARTEPREYGDLPDGSCPGIPDYSDVLDAFHVPRGLTLGANLDTESSFNASCDAFGDDSDQFDDEDGVTPRYRSIGGGHWYATVSVNGCAGTCYLNGWVDWGRDGDFDGDYDLVIDNVAGTSTELSFDWELYPPSGWTAGYYYLRFRVCDEPDECNFPGPGVGGAGATNGEVEDYRWYMNPTAATLSSFTAAWQAGDVVVDWQTASEVGLAGFNVWRSTDPALHGEQLNAVVIPPQTPGELTGNAYSYTDLTAVPGTIYYYWLEARQVGASSYWHGPMQPTGAFRFYLPVLLRGQ